MRPTSRRAFALAVLLASGAASADPGRADRKRLDDAEARALEQYAAKDFSGALKTADDALDGHAEAVRGELQAWRAISLRVRYLRAVSLRELGRLGEAEAAFAELAEQSADAEVRTRAVTALEKIRAERVQVAVFCPAGMYFRFYPAGARTASERGDTHVCAGAKGPIELSVPSGEYRVAWNHGYASDTRPVRLELGPAVHLHLVEPPKPPAVPPGGPGCGAPGG